jgi:hypothetical protein
VSAWEYKSVSVSVCGNVSVGYVSDGECVGTCGCVLA